jgi:hypothetical protein
VGDTSASASFRPPSSRQGDIVSEWKIEDGEFRLRVVIPEGCVARVVLPDGSSRLAPAGEHRFVCRMPG